MDQDQRRPNSNRPTIAEANAVHIGLDDARQAPLAPSESRVKLRLDVGGDRAGELVGYVDVGAGRVRTLVACVNLRPDQVAQEDEWQDGRHAFRPETLALIDAEPEIEEVVPTLLMAS